MGHCIGEYYRLIKGDTRSLDRSSSRISAARLPACGSICCVQTPVTRRRRLDPKLLKRIVPLQ